MTEENGKTKSMGEEKAADRIIRWLPIVACSAVTVLLAALFLILPARSFSENENRTLASLPAFSLEGFLEGSFQTQFEDHLADHYPGRDRWFTLSVNKERLLGKKEIGGVFYAQAPGEQTRLIDAYDAPQNTDKFISAVLRLDEKLEKARVTLLLVPTAVTLYADELPAHVSAVMPATQEETIRRIFDGIAAGDADGTVTCISAQQALEQGRSSGENMFYRTDHHWTTEGAYEGYKLLAPFLGLPESVRPDLKTASESFYGTTWSKVCDPDVQPDTIRIYENPAWAGTLRVRYEDTGEETDTPYALEYCKTKDQYSLFLNNLHPFISISDPGADTERLEPGSTGRRALAVVKDSYANSLIPFLIDHYETIYVFDPRYYRGGISGFVNEHPEIEDVLVLYNLCTMDSDRGIGAIN